MAAAARGRDPRHPALLELHTERARDVQLRLADAITAFAGTMTFVYIHVGIFGVWCATGLFGLDPFPFSFLTLTVSLEAIFLSTFVLIGQNRQAEFAQRKADHDFIQQQADLQRNTELTERVERLTQELLVRVRHQGSGGESG